MNFITAHEVRQLNWKTTARLSWVNWMLSAMLVIVLTGSTFSNGLADDQIRISFMEDAQVRNEMVRLGEVAEIQSPMPLRDELAQIKLTRSPDPGKTTTTKGSWIIAKLRNGTILPKNAEVNAPKRVIIRRSFQNIEEDDLRQFFMDYLEEQVGAENSDFEIRRFRVIGNKSVPEGSVNFRVDNTGPNKLSGYISLHILVEVNDKLAQRVDLSAWVERFEDVICLTESLPKGTVVSEQHFSFQRKNITKIRGLVITDPEDVVGKRLKRNLKSGTILVSNLLEIQPVIEKGDRVIIIAQSPTLFISSPGVAQTEGIRGEQIIVRNITSKKEIMAQIVDSSTVRVTY